MVNAATETRNSIRAFPSSGRGKAMVQDLVNQRFEFCHDGVEFG
jgi:hypothetical protein